MTLPKSITVNCPKCGKPFLAKVFVIISSDYAKNTAEQIMSGVLFDVICPQCKFDFHLDYDILYHDERHDAMIWVLHQNMPNYMQRVRDIRKATGAPHATERIVGNMDALKQKVTCLEYNRDDRIIELCKVGMLGSIVSQRSDFDFRNAFYTAISGKELIYFYDNKNNEICCELSDDVYDNLKDLYFNSQYAAQFDNNHPIVDFEWAKSILVKLVEGKSANSASCQEEKEEKNKQSHEQPSISAVSNSFNSVKNEQTIMEEQNEDIHYQLRDPDEISDRELVGNASDDVAVDVSELIALRKHKLLLSDMMRKLNRRDEIAESIYEMRGKSIDDQHYHEEMDNLNKSISSLNKSIEKIDEELSILEESEPVKNIIKRERVKWDEKVELRRQKIYEEARAKEEREWQEYVEKINKKAEELKRSHESRKDSAGTTIQSNLNQEEEKYISWKKKYPEIDGSIYRVAIPGTKFHYPKRCMCCLEPTDSMMHIFRHNFSMPVCKSCQEKKTNELARVNRELSNANKEAEEKAKRIVRSAKTWAIITMLVLYGILFLFVPIPAVKYLVSFVVCALLILIVPTKKITWTEPAGSIYQDSETGGIFAVQVADPRFANKSEFYFTNGAYAEAFAEANNSQASKLSRRVSYSKMPIQKKSSAKKVYHHTFSGYILAIIILLVLLIFAEPFLKKIDSPTISRMQATASHWLGIDEDDNSTGGSKKTNEPTKKKTTSTLRPFYAQNGQILIRSDYKAVCPFTVNAPSGSDYYIYLDYLKAPSKSYDRREPKVNATAPYESDIAFYVKAGSTASIKVPVGVYKLYYATGDTFYGTKEKFGEKTIYCVSANLMDFYTTELKYSGHTVSLRKSTNGNMETKTISENQFPD